MQLLSNALTNLDVFMECPIRPIGGPLPMVRKWGHEPLAMVIALPQLPRFRGEITNISDLGTAPYRESIWVEFSARLYATGNP